MKININLDNVKVKNDAKVLCGIEVKNNAKFDVTAKNIELSDSAQLLSDMQIEQAMEKAEEALLELDSSMLEYAPLKQIVKDRYCNKKELLKKIGKHIEVFTEGVLQNIISDIIRGKICL